MKKRLKEHSPNDNAWSKLQEKKGFETQLNRHLLDLPVMEPRADTWIGIQQKIEKKKQIAFFRPLLVAAVLAGILWFGYFLSNANLEINPVKENPDQFISDLGEAIQKNPDQSVEEVNSIKEEEGKVEPGRTGLEEKSGNRITEKPMLISKYEGIQTPKFSTRQMDLTLRGQFIPPTEVKNESFHQVTISWGMNEKKKFRIGQPKENLILTQDQLVGRETTIKKNQLLNFKIK